MAKKEKIRKEKEKNKAGKYQVVVVLKDETTEKETNVVFLKFSKKPKKKEIDDLVVKMLGKL